MIRAAKPGEGNALKIIHERSIRELCSKDYSPAQIEIWSAGTVQGYENLIANSPLCLVDERDGLLTGFVALKRNLSIWQLYILPEHAQNGIGRTLLTEAERYLTGRGETRSVAEASLTAAGFYQRCGYSVGSPSRVQFSGVDLDVVPVEKALTSP